MSGIRRRAIHKRLVEQRNTLARDYKALKATVTEMHNADDAYGCGFYGEESWLTPYKTSRALVGLPDEVNPAQSVLDLALAE